MPLRGMGSLWLFSLLEILANPRQPALLALGFAGEADVAAVQDEPVVRLGDDLVGEGLGKLLLHLQRSVGILHNAQSVGHPEHVRVNGKGGLVEDDRQDDIGGFTAHPRQGLQFLHVVGHHTVETFHQGLGQPF